MKEKTRNLYPIKQAILQDVESLFRELEQCSERMYKPSFTVSYKIKKERYEGETLHMFDS